MLRMCSFGAGYVKRAISLLLRTQTEGWGMGQRIEDDKTEVTCVQRLLHARIWCLACASRGPSAPESKEVTHTLDHPWQQMACPDLLHVGDATNTIFQDLGGSLAVKVANRC